jgi:putative glutamine amidotransferase
MTIPSSNLPRIAIPEPTSGDPAYNQRSLPQYIHAVNSAGGIAVPIPLQESPEVQVGLVSSCAGILLPGSPADLDPTRYGQDAIAECAAKDAAREAADDLLLGHALSHGKPVLGICFGLQSMNVWRHGSLIQDLPLASKSPWGSTSTLKVDHAPGREVQDAHAVAITPGSHLSKILSASEEGVGDLSRLNVNSSHHQAIDSPGERLRVAARSIEDGVIEALESDDPDTFVVAVQWHPERSYDTSPASRALFGSFLTAARVWESSRHLSSAAGTL